MFRLRIASVGDLPAIIAVDDEASTLYAQAGLHLSFPPGHPFVLVEQARWRRCAEAGSLFVAVDDAVIAGFAALEKLDGTAHLEQLSVRPGDGRRGLGTRLLDTAIEWAAGPLTLTTYRHVAWNGPWYERKGFRVIDEAALSPGLRERMAEERAALPLPEHRVAMRRDRER